jgi:PadR family transcriptional regulator PadR
MPDKRLFITEEKVRRIAVFFYGLFMDDALLREKGMNPVLLETRPRHGYEVRKLIETRSDSVLKFNAASLYPLLYRLEKRGWIEGRWVKKAGQRRRYYKLTKGGKKMLAARRTIWQSFAAAINRVSEFPPWPPGFCHV